MDAVDAALNDVNLANRMAVDLQSQGIDVDLQPISIDAIADAVIREGENWASVDGVYRLQTCPRGFLLMNTTVDTQECVMCETGTYAIDSTMGCGPQRCDARLCLPCPEGAVCESGNAPAWRHFQPVLLEVGAAVLPQITLEIPTLGVTEHLYCHGSEGAPKACVSGQGPSNQTASMGDYLWRYDESLPGFVLVKCPNGHQLINGSDGNFNAGLQKCKPCNVNQYIIPGDSQYSPCKPCPTNGAICNGANFDPIPADSEWVLEGANDGGLQYRLDLCPPGYALLRTEGNPPELVRNLTTRSCV